MNAILVLTLYAAVATLVSAYTFYHGVVQRARPTIFSLTDDVILLLATLVIGATWVLFVPALAVSGAVHASRYIAARPRGWALQWPEQLRAR